MVPAVAADLPGDGGDGVAAQRDAPLRVVAVDRLGQPEHRDLEHVVGVLVPRICAGQAMHHGHEAAHQLLTGVMVTGPVAAEEQVVDALVGAEGLTAWRENVRQRSASRSLEGWTAGSGAPLCRVLRRRVLLLT